MLMEHRMEILAPAGDEDMLRAAVFSGADCVYLGVKGFNARRGAGNFGPDALAGAVAFCHARGCGVYAAVNTLAFPGEEDALLQALENAYEAGCDAVIVQDMAAARLARSRLPGLALHASTQMSVHSLEGVRQLAQLGFSRAILARELGEGEIAAIAKASPIELEVFVHGALCTGVSGQCLLSAFLGGRSANRGACAGPCRLPFRIQAAGGQSLCDAARAGGLAPAADTHHLSLKDLSILDALPRLQAMGIAAAKIEGRLRGPEYCAVAVDCALKALNGEQYNKELLQNVFSRSGFTNAWFAGEGVGQGKAGCGLAPPAGMFGTRTGADSAAAKRALPQARQLYRRERPRVPVTLRLAFGPKGGNLLADDGTEQVQKTIEGPLPPAQQDNTAALKDALAKTGGTPFYLRGEAQVQTGGAFLPAGAVNRLRREALEELLALRQRPRREGAPRAGACPDAVAAALSPGAWQRRGPGQGPLLRARFASLGQMPQQAAEVCEQLVLPLHQALQVPQALRAKTVLWLPRVLFGRQEAETAALVRQTRDMGFAGYEVDGLAQIMLCEGLPMSGGLGLNCSNGLSALAYGELGVGLVTLSVEMSLRQMRQLCGSAELRERVATNAVCYGHLPLMVTRACPAKQLPQNQKCGKVGLLADRKGEAFPMVCADGVRSIYNPVPLWMADRLDEIPSDYATLYFGIETAQQARQVLAAYSQGLAAPQRFTRGLLDRGLADG